MSCSLHVVSWVVTNVLGVIRFPFTEYLLPCNTMERKLLLLYSSKRRHDWMAKLSRKRVEPNREFQGVFWSFVSGKVWSLLYGKPAGYNFALAVYMDRFHAAVGRMTKLSAYLKKS